MGLSGFAAGASNALAFAFDTSMFKIAIRDDIEMRMFDQGAISDGAGVVLLNLMQQDAKVLRVTFRLAWVAANPVTLQAPTRTASYPASVLTQGTFVGALGVEQALFESRRPCPATGAPPCRRRPRDGRGRGRAAHAPAGDHPDGRRPHRHHPLGGGAPCQLKFSERQQKFFGAELAGAEKGQKTRTGIERKSSDAEMAHNPRARRPRRGRRSGRPHPARRHPGVPRSGPPGARGG